MVERDGGGSGAAAVAPVMTLALLGDLNWKAGVEGMSSSGVVPKRGRDENGVTRRDGISHSHLEASRQFVDTVRSCWRRAGVTDGGGQLRRTGIPLSIFSASSGSLDSEAAAQGSSASLCTRAMAVRPLWSHHLPDPGIRRISGESCTKA